MEGHPSNIIEMSICDTKATNVWKKVAQSLQEALDLLQNLPSERSDAPADDSSHEEVRANNSLEFSSDFEEDDQETEQDSGSAILVFGYHFDMAKKRIRTQDEIDRYMNNSDKLSEDGLEYTDDDVDFYT
ncbi:hypothetical protein TNCV_1776881 [Trichonephila clavipes]|nr:hypothetical protein TNCV_1776881 [Trichonephila clavipes]